MTVYEVWTGRVEDNGQIAHGTLDNGDEVTYVGERRMLADIKLGIAETRTAILAVVPSWAVLSITPKPTSCRAHRIVGCPCEGEIAAND